MENQDVQKFDDAGLKAAINRHYSCSECCPLRLRQRISQLFNDPADSTPSAPELKLTSVPTMSLSRWQRAAKPGVAIAAVMVLALGAVTLVLTRSSHSLPIHLQNAAVARHDSCSQYAIHVDTAIPRDFAGMGQYLRMQLNHSVLAADLTKDRWHFRGAAICPVGEVKSAHLLFDQGSRTLSVFSLPASSFPSLQDQQTYDGSSEGHAIVARREGNAVYCLVESDPTGGSSVSQLREMLKSHASEASVASAPAVSNARLAVAIAREP